VQHFLNYETDVNLALFRNEINKYILENEPVQVSDQVSEVSFIYPLIKELFLEF
jgi:hypothetical protein